MATVYYPAIVERAGAGYSVFFPDLPGCTSAGDTLQEAARSAEEALEGHLAVTAEAGESLPDPSELDSLERDPEVEEVARILVRGEKPGRSVRINITMDESLVTAIDRKSSNRSGFIAEAARAALGWHIVIPYQEGGIYPTKAKAVSAAKVLGTKRDAGTGRINPGRLVGKADKRQPA